jgi:hypothetical protein
VVVRANRIGVFYVVRVMPTAGQRANRHILTRDMCFLCRDYIKVKRMGIERRSRVEAGSNTSTLTLRVVGGDEKGSLESETVKELGSDNECTDEGQQ